MIGTVIIAVLGYGIALGFTAFGFGGLARVGELVKGSDDYRTCFVLALTIVVFVAAFLMAVWTRSLLGGAI